ncbi:MAG: translation initiation factor SUI1 [Candidatus Bathyarchaeota archaeon B24]|nr:MAG: translation initiation factor SUI1 [Candidatus Bathyarchaeota archaeon B24]
MQEICKVCGLPKDLCICGEISKEQQRIVVKLERRRYGKPATIIEGINDKNIDLRKIAQDLKTVCACGGTAKNNKVILQGDHRDKVKRYLVKMGFPEANIEVE